MIGRVERKAALESNLADNVVTVDLGPRSYEVRVVRGAADGFGPAIWFALTNSWAGRSCRSALVVTDTNVQPLIEPYRDGLDIVGIPSEVVALAPGESSKSLESAQILFDALIAMKADRHTAIVAIGGGVIGDLAGFVAATYARGLPLVMVPTTLLAQVDSAVGGKVGVNLPKAKNIVGAFHQPAAVWIDTETLRTLPDRELRCGLAEVVKYGVILDAGFFHFLEERAEAILDRDPDSIARIVATSCRLKADVVSRDEREETGLRAVLNFGHTIGHAIEAVAGYGGAFQHGEAVAVGMIAETRLARRIGWIDETLEARLRKLLERFGLPVKAHGLPCDALIEAMRRDKKNARGAIRFVLPRSLGHVELTDLPTEADVRAVLETL